MPSSPAPCLYSRFSRRQTASHLTVGEVVLPAMGRLPGRLTGGVGGGESTLSCQQLVAGTKSRHHCLPTPRPVAPRNRRAPAPPATSGRADGEAEGATDGDADGDADGAALGEAVCAAVGAAVSPYADGEAVGDTDGAVDGRADGEADGDVGEADGAADGTAPHSDARISSSGALTSCSWRTSTGSRRALARGGHVRAARCGSHSA